MFEKLKELFANGKLSEAGLNKAISKGWITKAEAVIIGSSMEEKSDMEEHDGQT